MKKLNSNSLDKIDFLLKDEKENLLAELREKISELDNQIVKLLSERANYSKIVGSLKSSLDLPLYSIEREKGILNKLMKNLSTSQQKKFIERIYERIFDESRFIQREEVRKEKNEQA